MILKKKKNHVVTEWGLPVIETVACGLPVIAPVTSALTEYLEPIKSEIYAVDARPELVENCPLYTRWLMPGEVHRDQWWQCSPRLLSEQILRCSYDLESGLAQENANDASQLIREKFSWERAAEVAWKRLLDGPLNGLNVKVGG